MSESTDILATTALTPITTMQNPRMPTIVHSVGFSRGRHQGRFVAAALSEFCITSV